MNLVIVESPTKTKSLSKYLGGDYQVLASMGHIRDLPKSKMGVEVKKSGEVYEFLPEYKPVVGKGEQLKKLKMAAAKAEKIILATDPDREGEAIAWHVAELIGGKKEMSRIAFHSITKEAVLEALSNPRQIDMALVDAQQARRVLDRLVGYQLSPVLWRKVRRGLSAGRVQSVAVRLVVDKEKEIEAFKPDEYWQIKVVVKTADGEVVTLDLENKIKNEEEAKKALGVLETAEYVVFEVKRIERKVAPHPPFKTSTLQQAAANVLGWSAKKTMSVAQKLYEQGDITYHRTDSFNLADTAMVQINTVIEQKFGKEYLVAGNRHYRTGGKVVAQEAHEAIRPTHFEVYPEEYRGQGQMAADENKLYGLIWKRTVASQMMEAIFDDTKVKVKAGNDYRLGVAGETVKFDGWKKLYKQEKEVILPEMKEGDRLEKGKIASEQKFTMPPARYNDASLIKELEKRGIGRPSTYATILTTIIDRNYVERKEKRFYPTAIGVAVTEFLVKNFPQEMSYEFTAKMEEGLDDVARGKQKWMNMLSDFYGSFESKVKVAQDTGDKVEIAVEKTGKVCPKCKQGELVIRSGKFGKFYSCDRYPECDYKANMIIYLEGAKCEKCGGRVVVRKTRFGKEFYGCENYPKCDWASWRKPVIKEEKEEVGEVGEE